MTLPISDINDKFVELEKILKRFEDEETLGVLLCVHSLWLTGDSYRMAELFDEVRSLIQITEENDATVHNLSSEQTNLIQ